MKYRTKEALVGYLFATPIILTVLIFTIYPIIAAFYYSLTDYQPLEARKFTYTFDPYDALELHTGVLKEEAKDYTVDELKEYFDPVTFVELDVGVKLSEEEKKIVKDYFDSLNLLNDFKEGKLPKQIKISDFMKKYMKGHSERFTKYVPRFVGLQNFKEMFKDMYFYTSFWNALLYSIIVVPIQTLLAIILAVAANSKIRGVNFFKSVFFLPAITSSAALSMIFWLIYSKPGVLNKILLALFGRLGFQPVDYLNEPKVALFAIMAMNIWSTAGYFMVTFLAGLQDIPSSIYEAARIDGATGTQIFWKITIPLLRPQIVFVSIMGTIGCMQVFDQIYFLIRNLRNITISYYIYKNAFEYGKMGYASALAVVLFAVILALSLIQRKVIKEEY
ncbi:Binding-protein-dependent transport system inner membrane component [Fervidobacterium changbaicum]|uniref:Sugar ABC transporter permease n=1 Tax=Fervidobacterium changbaicum TaxID=310769 RepID=A0ABX5QRX9_9BACT|nr:sugar ABC transporter permease [Fervidobacterium changbaicum]QAV33226.1 sugar ABC transporter permease [Fervidobacterium changbaicum]SDH75779.1 Binding-protein-dependent transport system inner membrane component [Fervidobacterium changbaicum]